MALYLTALLAATAPPPAPPPYPPGSVQVIQFELVAQPVALAVDLRPCVADALSADVAQIELSATPISVCSELANRTGSVMIRAASSPSADQARAERDLAAPVVLSFSSSLCRCSRPSPTSWRSA